MTQEEKEDLGAKLMDLGTEIEALGVRLQNLACDLLIKPRDRDSEPLHVRQVNDLLELIWTDEYVKGLAEEKRRP